MGPATLVGVEVQIGTEAVTDGRFEHPVPIVDGRAAFDLEGGTYTARIVRRLGEPTSKSRDIVITIPNGVRATIEIQPDFLDGPPEKPTDDQRWTGAQVARCQGATVDTDCDGVRGYLRELPGGGHASEAVALLSAAQSRFDEANKALLAAEKENRKREEAAGLSVTAMQPALEETAQAKLDRIAGDPVREEHKGVRLEVRFDLTAARKQTAATMLKVTARCAVAGKRKVGTTIVDSTLDTLLPGDTKSEQGRPYGLTEKFLEAPSMCEVVVMTGPPLGDGGTPLHSVCFVPGSALREGSCTWP